MKNSNADKRREMAQAEYKASADFYAGVRKAERESAGKKQREIHPRQNLHEIVNVLEGRWMH